MHFLSRTPDSPALRTVQAGDALGCLQPSCHGPALAQPRSSPEPFSSCLFPPSHSSPCAPPAPLAFLPPSPDGKTRCLMFWECFKLCYCPMLEVPGRLFFKVSPFLLSCTEKTSSAEADEWNCVQWNLWIAFFLTIIEWSTLKQDSLKGSILIIVMTCILRYWS